MLNVITNKKTYTLNLPETKMGKYYVEDDSFGAQSNKILSVEADDASSHWVLCSDESVQLLDSENQPISRIVLEDNRFFSVRTSKNPEDHMFVYLDENSDDIKYFRKFQVSSNVVIKIGRLDDNDIIFSNDFVSKHHALLVCSDGNWCITVKENSNGTYVNGVRVEREKFLQCGDIVSIFEFRIIIGFGFIAMNCVTDKVVLNNKIFSEYKDSIVETLDEQKTYTTNTHYRTYYRSPRLVPKLEPVQIEVDMPPARHSDDRPPLALSMAPQFMMGVASLTTAVFAVVNVIRKDGDIMSSIPSMIMAVAMLGGMVLFPLILRKREQRVKEEHENERRMQYRKYLGNLGEDIDVAIKNQEIFLLQNRPYIMDYIAASDFWDNNLWCKTSEHADFLEFRLGIGNEDLHGEVKYPEDRFTLDDDTLKEELKSFKKRDNQLTSVPLTVSLMDHTAVGVFGEESSRYNLFNNVLLQIAALHSYDEVKIIALVEKKDKKRLDYLWWMQHTWDDSHVQRYIATDEQELRDLSAEINRMINDRNDKKLVLPRFLIVSASSFLYNKASFIDDILTNRYDGYSLLIFAEKRNELPKEATAVIEVNGKTGMIHEYKDEKIRKASFVQDLVSHREISEITKKISFFKLDLNGGKYSLPDMLTFLSMFEVNKVENLNIPQRWEQNDATVTLRTPVGIDVNGDLFNLDLHQKAHGPHGLIAGMTGSGKSEFIITYILSLAVNYSPEDVSFVLIDYKGGGLTAAFENDNYRLPHLAGTITNLDGSSVTRAILAIESEIKRREKIFKQAAQLANEATMDIYKYQKMYKDGLLSEPMSHLFIISDEFAELKTQEPEFMDQLISTARVGRSLGVHLILATQKPAGVVNDQIWSNARFRVCLKVQTAADSKDMLKRPDAAELSETGRFYLQVGYNELFELGQSAWTGAPYNENGNVKETKQIMAEVINTMGNVIDRVKINTQQETNSKTQMQLVPIVHNIIHVADSMNMHSKRLWLEPIPNIIYRQYVIDKYAVTHNDYGKLSALVGITDNPYEQRQAPCFIDFTKNGNTVIHGSAGVGEEMLISALLFDMCSVYESDEFCFGILDLGTEALRCYSKMPNCVGYAIDGEDRKIENFFDFADNEAKSRKKLLSEFDGSLEYYNQSAERKLPYLLLIINNFPAFFDSYDLYENRLISLTRDCNRFGIYFCITSNGNLRSRIAKNFGNRIAMKLTDKMDYFSVFGSTQGVFPNGADGNGIIQNGDRVYEFQTYTISEDREKFNSEIAALIRKNSKTIDYPGYRFDIEDVVEGNVIKTQSDVIAPVLSKKTNLGVNIGYSTEDSIPEKFDFGTNNVLFVFADDNQKIDWYKNFITKEFFETVSDYTFFEILADRINVFQDGVSSEITEETAIEDRICEFASHVRVRNLTYTLTNGDPKIDMSPRVVFIRNWSELRKSMSDSLISILAQSISDTQCHSNYCFIICASSMDLDSVVLDEPIKDRFVSTGLLLVKSINESNAKSFGINVSNLISENDEKGGFYIRNNEIIPITYAKEIE